MDKFPSNSKSNPRASAKAQKTEPLEKVITGEASRRKKPLSKRLSENFVNGDAKSVWNFIAYDLLIPAAKDMLADAVSQGFERMLFGESSGRGVRPGRAGRTNGYTSYNRMSGPSTRYGGMQPVVNDPRPTLSRQARSTHNFDEIVLETRADAEEVIDRLFANVAQYESTTVGDLYDLVGLSGNFADEKWGWNDLSTASVSRVRHGWLLNLPRPVPLD